MANGDIYICCATRHWEVNLEPLLAGLSDVRSVLVLRNADSQQDDPESATPTLHSIRILERRGFCVQVLDVPIHDLWGIKKILVEWLLTNNKFTSIIFNATGGTKAMSWAAFSAIVHVAPKNYKAFLYQSDPVVSAAVFAGNSMDPIALNKPGLNLEEFLYLRGYDILSSSSEAAKQEQLTARAPLARWIYNAATTGDADIVCGVLNRMAMEGGLGDLHTPFPRIINEDNERRIAHYHSDRNFVSDLLSAPGIEAVIDFSNANFIRIPNKESLCFLGGGWLEEAIYSIVIDALSHCPHTHVAINLRLALSEHRTNQATDEVRECDVAILIGGRLHILECKTGAYGGKKGDHSNGLNQDIVNKLSAIHRHLSGTFSITALLNPRPVQDHHKKEKTLLVRAQGEGLHMWTGAKMEPELRRALDSLVRAAIPAGSGGHDLGL